MEVAHTAGLAFCLVLKTKARTNKKGWKNGGDEAEFYTHIRFVISNDDLIYM
jgi:hypothetical protein